MTKIPIRNSGAGPERPGFFRRAGRRIVSIWEKTYPGPSVRRGAAAGISGVFALFIAFFGWYLRPGLPGILDELSGILMIALFAGLAGILTALALKILRGLPRFLNRSGLVIGIVFVLTLAVFQFPAPTALLLGLVFGASGALLGAGWAALRDPEFRFARPWRKIWALVRVGLPAGFFVFVLIWVQGRGSTGHLRDPEAFSGPGTALQVPNPARTGPFRVKTLCYGSGRDRHRPEFGEDADLITRPVDASPFLKGNRGWEIQLRHRYWGFDFEAFPVNGRVWQPEGPGPFPLVLCVHGNHKMQEFSDPGYAYLGELLAGRGFLFVSVDENFFNGGFPGGLSRENDGRAWMLLQHLKVWREWNAAPDNPFYRRVDMSRIGLIGHSRGGEAAAIAGQFNRLSHYPDDATVTFDFDFGIRAIAAIAPSDQQYKPGDRPTPLENVNYLVIQGAHDSDVSVFAGARQFQRVSFTDGRYWFKAALYSYRSNHGQFNTVWGDNDWGDPLGFLLNRRALLDGEDQRRLGKVVLAAFLEAALHGESGYIPLFRDPRTAADWLPEDIYLARFQDAAFHRICDFEEDVDVTRGSLPGTRLSGTRLAVWKEGDLSFRNRGTKQNHGVFLGWRGPAAERTGDRRPTYSIRLPEEFALETDSGEGGRLVFSLTEADEELPEIDEDSEDGDTASSERGEDSSEDGREALEIGIELIDAAGTAVLLPLDRFQAVPPPLRTRFTRLPGERGLLGRPWEPTLRTFELPLGVFREAVPEFDPGLLRIIRFVFDRGREGVVFLDDIGFTPDRAFIPGRPLEGP